MAIKKIRMRPEGTNDYADVLHPETSADNIIDTTTKVIMTQAERTKLAGLLNATKESVGLGSVEDYGVATKAEAEAKVINNKYMTPLTTKYLTDTLLIPVNGTYTGNVTNRTIELGFRAKLVIVWWAEAKTTSEVKMIIIVDNIGIKLEYNLVIQGNDKSAITASGFTIGDDGRNLNQLGKIYKYIAFK